MESDNDSCTSLSSSEVYKDCIDDNDDSEGGTKEFKEYSVVKSTTCGAKVTCTRAMEGWSKTSAKDSVKEDKIFPFLKDNSSSEYSNEEAETIYMGDSRRSSSASGSDYSRVVPEELALVNQKNKDDSKQKTDEDGIVSDDVNEKEADQNFRGTELFTTVTVTKNESEKVEADPESVPPDGEAKRWVFLAASNEEEADQSLRTDAGTNSSCSTELIPPATVNRKKRLKVEAANDDDDEAAILASLLKIPKRHVLYPIDDPRNERENAILRCFLCGQKYIFLDEDILRKHLETQHKIT